MFREQESFVFISPSVSGFHPVCLHVKMLQICQSFIYCMVYLIFFGVYQVKFSGIYCKHTMMSIDSLFLSSDEILFSYSMKYVIKIFHPFPKETPEDSSQSSRKPRTSKNKKKEQEKAAAAATSSPDTNDKKKAPKVTMDSSAVTLGDAKINNRRDLHSHPVMITDTLSDVRIKYHINPKEIGHGHYGVVRKCMDRETKKWYAIKSIRKSKVGKVDVLKREVALLKECEHPNIILLIEVHEDQKYLHLITELCTGGELFDRIIEKTQSDEGHFSERDAANLVRSILDAIAYCHDQKGIVHRDLKPENFLFSSKDEDAVIKIIDFGLSRHDDMQKGIMNTKVGTPYYVAPEVLNREYTKSCDIWSIGVSVCESRILSRSLKFDLVTQRVHSSRS